MIKERVMVVGVCVCGHVMQMLIGVKARSTVAMSLICLFSHLSLTVRVTLLFLEHPTKDK